MKHIAGYYRVTRSLCNQYSLRFYLQDFAINLSIVNFIVFVIGLETEYQYTIFILMYSVTELYVLSFNNFRDAINMFIQSLKL